MLLAYIDESGDRGTTPKSSDYFVMTAVVVRDKNLLHADLLFAGIKHDLRRRPTQELSWKGLKTLSDRFLAVHAGESTTMATSRRMSSQPPPAANASRSK